MEVKQEGIDIPNEIDIVESKKPSNHYIDNEEFYREFVQFRKDNEHRVAAGLRPNIPDSIGKKLLAICNNLIKRHNFSRYHFKDEMISDALIICTRYIWSYDPNIKNNPFSYFTKTVYQSFVHTIKEHKKKSDRLNEYIDHQKIFPDYEQVEAEDSSIKKDLEDMFGSFSQDNEIDDE